MPLSFRSSPAFANVVSGGQSYDPDIRVDVVAVPAVGAEPIDTWTTGGRNSDNWLETDLLANLPIARVLYYDHGHPADDDGLTQLAYRLLDLLLTERKTKGPLLAFVCHSTGGLVLKQALVLARTNKKYIDVLESCVGIVFFAVPHRGSELLSNPNFSADVRKAANAEWRYDKPHRQADNKRYYRFQMPSRLCSELRPVIFEALREGEEREVSYLIGLAVAFSDLLDAMQPQIKIWSYYESVQAGLTTKVRQDGSRESWFKDTDDLIVSADSARLWREDEELDIGLPCDHCSTAAFDTMYPNIYGSMVFPDRKYKGTLIQQLHSLVSERYWPTGDPMENMQVENMFFFQPTRMGGIESSSVSRSFHSLLNDNFGDFLDQINEKDAVGTPSRPIMIPHCPSPSKLRKKPTVSAMKSSKPAKSHLTPVFATDRASKGSARSSSDHGGDGDNQHVSSQSGVKVHFNAEVSKIDTSVPTAPSVISEARVSSDAGHDELIPQSFAKYTEKRRPSTNGSPLRYNDFSPTAARGSISSEHALWGFESAVSNTPIYRFRWIHSPYTHTELAKAILQKLIQKMPLKQRPLNVVDEKFWSKKQNTATHTSPHARYLHSTCEFSDATVKEMPISEELRELLSEKGSKIVSSLSDYLSRTKEKDTSQTDHPEDDICKASQMILYLPYLHWESFKHLNRREFVIKERMKSNRKVLKTGYGMRNDPEPIERPPSILDSPFLPDEKYPFAQAEVVPSAEQKSVEDDLIDNVSIFKKIKGYVENSPELRLLWHHIIPGEMLHCRRSLDQYMYSTLPDTSARDRDQILYKCTRKGETSPSNQSVDHDGSDDHHDAGNDVEDDTGNVLVVDQLWMWVMDDASVVTFFPPKEVEISTSKDKPVPAHSSAVDLDPSNFVAARLVAAGDLRTCIQREMEDSDDPFKNQWDLAGFIVKHVVTALFDRFENSGPQALRNFAEYIDRLIEKQATSWASLNLRRGLSLADSSKEIKQVFQDLRDLRELRDVEDELRIITKILSKQHVHISKMQQMYDKLLGLGKSKGAGYLQEALDIIGRKQEQVRRMTTNMDMAKKGFEELISLQQGQISINQAVAAGKQSRAVTIFTVFTVFFLPLSFFTSLYGMNVSEWGGNQGTVSIMVILSTMLPLSFVVIVLAVLFAMNSSFRQAVTSTFEIVVECIIIVMEIVSTWSGVSKLSKWLGQAKKSVGTGWISAFKRSVKRHKKRRRKACAARTQEKLEKKTRERRQIAASGFEVPVVQRNGSGRRRSKWKPFQKTGQPDQEEDSDSDDGGDPFA